MVYIDMEIFITSINDFHNMTSVLYRYLHILCTDKHTGMFWRFLNLVQHFKWQQWQKNAVGLRVILYHLSSIQSIGKLTNHSED